MKKNKPLISVIVPVYNVEVYLKECLKSIQNQTLTNFEVLCVNDGSTDSSGTILENFAAKDKRFKVIHQQNQGPAAARNAALSCAKGDYIAFVDSDDFIYPDYLETLYQTAEKTKTDVVVYDYISGMHVVKQPKRNNKPPVFYNEDFSFYLNNTSKFTYNVWNKFYKRSVIGKTRFPDLLYEDLFFNLFVFAKVKNAVFIDEKLYFYRLSNNSIMRSPFSFEKLESYIKGIYLIYDKFQNNPENLKTLKKTVVCNIVKSVLKELKKTKNAGLIRHAATELRLLKNTKRISYQHLSVSKKLKLFYLLHFVK